MTYYYWILGYIGLIGIFGHELQDTNAKIRYSVKALNKWEIFLIIFFWPLFSALILTRLTKELCRKGRCTEMIKE